MKRIFACLLGLLILTGCTKAPEVVRPPAATLPPAASPAPSLSMEIEELPALSPIAGLTPTNYIPSGNFFNVQGWWDAKSFWASQGNMLFNNMQVNGARQGNTVAVHLVSWETDHVAVGQVAVTPNGGETHSIDVYTALGSYENACMVQFADIDANGTDEIILFIQAQAGSGEGDLHIFTYEGDVVREIYTMLGMSAAEQQLRELYKETQRTDARPTGVAVAQNGSALALCVTLAAEERANRRYCVLAFQNGILEMAEEPVELTQQAQKEYLQSLKDDLKLGESDAATVAASGTPVRAAGKSEPQAELFVHSAYENAADKTHILIEARYPDGKRALLRSFQSGGASGYNYSIHDMDGDAAEEVFFVLSRQEGAKECIEMHMMKLDESGLNDVLTYYSVLPEDRTALAGQRVFLLPNAAELPYASVEELNASVNWAEVVPWQETYCIEMAHGDTERKPQAYSRICWEKGQWMLLEQGLPQTPPEETPPGDEPQRDWFGEAETGEQQETTA